MFCLEKIYVVLFRRFIPTKDEGNDAEMGKGSLSTIRQSCQKIKLQSKLTMFLRATNGSHIQIQGLNFMRVLLWFPRSSNT